MRRGVCLLFAAGILVTACRAADDTPPPRIDSTIIYRELFAEFQPVKLANCEFERVGDAHDGGYVICQNLVDRAQALYSYGISASDQWGCTLSARLKLPVHQYDCFNLDRPALPGRRGY